MIDRLWIFDSNRRVYEKKDGFSGSPIWREHWREEKVIGETSRSWVVSFGKKVPKKGGYGIAFSIDEINNQAYIKNNAYKIGENVSNIKDHELLKKIAGLVGYDNE